MNGLHTTSRGEVSPLVGKASFSVRQRGRIGNRSVIELAGEASTTGLARGLIEVEDEMISVVDAATLAPLRTETRLREGKRRKQITADYNWSDGTVKLTNGTHFRVPAQTLDLVSLFYAVRAAPLTVGGVFNFGLLNANHRLLVLTFKAAKVEQIGSQLGNLPAIQVDVLRDKDLLAQVWISNDTRRIPLYLAVKTRFGELRLTVSTATGLR